MKIPIELQNIIYQYKMDMDFLLLKKEWKRNKELKKSYCDLTNKFSQIYLKIQKFKLGDKIINSKTKRIGSVVDIYRINNNTSVVIEYDDQKDIHWCISDDDIYDFIHYKPNRFIHINNNFSRDNTGQYYACITILIAILFLLSGNIINFSTLHVFLFNFISFMIICFVLLTIYTIRQMNALRSYRNFQFN
jgi:hypothetical protein